MKFVLLPLAMIYGAVMRVRNILFDLGLFKALSFQTPVIVVGNLRVGGTGKTPTVLALIELLETKNNLAVLSRGYGRESRGWKAVDIESEANEVGDEPLLIKKKNPEVMVAVHEKRVQGIKKILESGVHTRLIILDDAMQHRWVKPGHLVLLTAYHKRYTTDFLLPMGRLREPRASSARADTIIVTKCPRDMDSQNRKQIRDELALLPHQELFFAYEDYEGLSALSKDMEYSWESLGIDAALLVTGLADSSQVHQYVSKSVEKVSHLDFSDHHKYGLSDMERIQIQFEKLDAERKAIITTEKDAQRIVKWMQNQKFADLPIYILKHKLSWFEQDEEGLKKRLDGFISAYKGNNRIPEESN